MQVELILRFETHQIEKKTPAPGIQLYICDGWHEMYAVEFEWFDCLLPQQTRSQFFMVHGSSQKHN